MTYFVSRKSVSFSVLLGSLCSVSSFANADTPWIRKSSGGGLVPPQYSQWETCAMYSDRVEITRNWGELSTKETIAIQLNGSVSKLVEEASTESLSSTPNGLCDAPATTIEAFNTGSTKEPVLLYFTGGCGSPGKQREGSAAWALQGLIDSYCPKTYRNPVFPNPPIPNPNTK
jgi:hypothetical protein